MKNKTDVDFLLTTLDTAIKRIGEWAIPLTNMEARVYSGVVIVAAAIVPERGVGPTFHFQRIEPLPYSRYFPQTTLVSQKAPKAYMRVKEKLERVVASYQLCGSMSAWDTRTETRGGKNEGQWEGAFVAEVDGFVIAFALSGFTGKLDEAILLLALIEVGILSYSRANKLSRPHLPGMNPRRYYDYFFNLIYENWQKLNQAENDQIVEEHETRVA